jgi:hypothetical protein
LNGVVAFDAHMRADTKSNRLRLHKTAPGLLRNEIGDAPRDVG